MDNIDCINKLWETLTTSEKEKAIRKYRIYYSRWMYKSCDDIPASLKKYLLRCSGRIEG